MTPDLALIGGLLTADAHMAIDLGDLLRTQLRKEKMFGRPEFTRD